MAKKKHKKKHNFKHTAASPAAVSATSTVASAKGTSKANTVPNEWQEVAADVRRVLILAAVFIGLMIGLWLVLENTSFGPQLYKSIHL